MTAYGRLGDERYLASVERALPQYERIYRQGGGRDTLPVLNRSGAQARRRAGPGGRTGACLQQAGAP